MELEEMQGVVFNIQPFSLHDGPGIRTIVFLKGCPLRCLWCDNPESMNPAPELGFARVCCDKCDKCFAVCPEEALLPDGEGFPLIDRERCTVCAECVKVCAPEALAIYGRKRSVKEVFQEVRRDASYFCRSGGGVTVSGGEALYQSSFVTGLFQLCREAGIHTCIETSGFVSPQVLKEVLPLTDLVLYDLKHLNEEEHRRLTGQPNGLILSNARVLAGVPAQVLFRMPLIPGLNSTPENIQATARFLLEVVGDGATLELMPYHRLGMGKYKALGQVYPLEGLASPDPGFVDTVKQTFERAGVRCLVSK